jgi:hypothetical protein
VLQLVRWVFVASAFLTSAITLYLAYDYVTFPRHVVRVPGTVVELRRDDDAYYPIVKFVTSEGEEITLVANWGANPSPYGLGEQVTVMYPPGDPRSGRVDSFAWYGIPLLIAGLISLVHGAVALFMFVSVRKAPS